MLVPDWPVAPYPEARPARDPPRDAGADRHARSSHPRPSSFDRAKKLAIDAREGVTCAWLIDPLARTLEVSRLESGSWTILATHAGNEVVRAEPFEAIELELAALWGETT